MPEHCNTYWRILILITPIEDSPESSKILKKAGEYAGKLFNLPKCTPAVIIADCQEHLDNAYQFADGAGFRNNISGHPALESIIPEVPIDGYMAEYDYKCLIAVEQPARIDDFLSLHQDFIKSPSRSVTHQGQVILVQYKDQLLDKIHFTRYATGDRLPDAAITR